MSTYIKRIVERQIEDLLENFCAVLIRGPKWCGKSTTGKAFSKSEILLSNLKRRQEYDAINANDPSVFLQGEKPRLIDEWQLYPRVWDEIVAYSNETASRGQFVLTGSKAPRANSTNHSGTMRIARVNMTNLSLYESGESSGEVSLKSLFDHPEKGIKGQAAITKKETTRCIVRGGYPQIIADKPKNETIFARQYLDAICETDIQEASEKNLSPETARALLRSLARNLSQPVDNKTIIADVNAFGRPLAETAFYDYSNAFLKLYDVDEIPAWRPSLRSKTSIRASPKKLFYDPSLACAALGVGEDDLNYDFRTRGFFFECLAGRDLRVYSDALGGRIAYYRDRLGLECDYVVHMPDGRYGLFECKCGSDFIEDGIKTLDKFVALIEAANAKSEGAKIPLPTIRAVLTDEGYAIRQKNGIFIIPLSCLKD